MLNRRAHSAFFEPISLIVIGALLFASCGDSASGDDDGAGAPTEVESSAEVDPAGDDAAAPADDATAEDAAVDAPVADDAAVAEDEPAEEDTTTDADAAAGDGGCLVGSWVITGDTMNGYYDALESTPEMAGGDVDFTITGDTALEFRPDGTYTYRPDFALAMVVGDMSGDGAASGELSGDYVIEDGIVTTTVTDDAIEMTITVAGITMSSSDIGMDIESIAPISSAPVDCSGETPTLGFEVSEGTRVPVVLSPA